MFGNINPNPRASVFLLVIEIRRHEIDLSKEAVFVPIFIFIQLRKEHFNFEFSTVYNQIVLPMSH